jgi:hypothetical protein
MNITFKSNLIIAVSYTVFFVLISFVFDTSTRDILLGFVYKLVALIHFMTMSILSIVNHFKGDRKLRNGYLASTFAIWVLAILVSVIDFYIR